MTTFARLSRPLIEILQELPPCARQLHLHLLEAYPAGKPQEVDLDEFAERCNCGVKYIRHCLRLLLTEGVVESLRRYSGSIYRLIVHDDRTLDFSTGKKCVQDDEICGHDGQIRGHKQPSNPDAAVTNNREIFRENRDTLPLHPVSEEEPKGALVTPPLPSDGAVPEPGFPQHLEAELQQVLQQPLNKNIRAVLLEYPETRARDALDALQEAMAAGNVKNPAGWFVQAIRKGYKPNSARRSAPSTSQAVSSPPEPPKPQLPDGFRIWFELAFKTGVALASEQTNDGEVIIHGKDCAEPFEQARQTWPLEKLQALLERPRSVSASVAPPQPPEPAQVPEGIDDERQRQNALARLRAKFALPLLKAQAVREAKAWGFDVTGAGIFEVAF